MSTLIGAIGKTPNEFVVQHDLHIFELRDGSSHRHYFVAIRGERQRWLRAVTDSRGTHFAIFDLREVCPQLALDLPHSHERDVPGLVKFSLRMVWAYGADLNESIARHCLAYGAPVPLH